MTSPIRRSGPLISPRSLSHHLGTFMSLTGGMVELDAPPFSPLMGQPRRIVGGLPRRGGVRQGRKIYGRDNYLCREHEAQAELGLQRHD